MSTLIQYLNESLNGWMDGYITWEHVCTLNWKLLSFLLLLTHVKKKRRKKFFNFALIFVYPFVAVKINFTLAYEIIYMHEQTYKSLNRNLFPLWLIVKNSEKFFVAESKQDV